MGESVFSVLVSNRFGVLNKVTTLFSRRGCNIHSLSVCPEREGDMSRITITMREEERHRVMQILEQLRKLEDVKEAVLAEEGGFVERTVALIRLRRGSDTGALREADLAVRRQSLPDGGELLEVTGPAERVDEFISGLDEGDIEGLSRAGLTALILS